MPEDSSKAMRFLKTDVSASIVTGAISTTPSWKVILSMLSKPLVRVNLTPIQRSSVAEGIRTQNGQTFSFLSDSNSTERILLVSSQCLLCNVSGT
ncbi:hypothetical protein M0R45_026902 [Rubus argutus]|uniref:Uncharacterized protein n=1 Tax=Rubus argutus TaxID=59490 RepID=A0AAW1X093_RUBAR